MRDMRPEDRLLTPAEVAVMFRVPRTSPTFPARVFSKIDASGDCWEWTGTLDKRSGYGVLGRGVRGAGNIQAHRAAWELLCGSMAADMQLDHLCRNRPCCNPDHLEPVTAEENKRRGYGLGPLYAARRNCGYGHPLDGVTRRKDGTSHRYCKTCARLKGNARYVPKGPRTHCKRDHEFTARNTHTDRRGHRACKACKIQRQRDTRAAVRAEMGKAA